MNNVFAQELQKIRKSQKILTMFVLLFVVIIVWAVVSLFSAKQTTKVDKQLLDLAKPLNPTIDTSIFATLQLKRSFSDTELANFPIYQLLTNDKSREQVVVPLGVTKDELNSQNVPEPTPSPSQTPALSNQTIDG
ncbi:MAG: hypothetical protein GW947_04605 [Candidatus Pacebacteria bacterium]|nr:hypothetical protein [Candidatus Paceibacterota bacterium]PIR59977.1 MAG: hypothetical protein COU67_04310 [Candidatus Pacebacteria bacterium CG10_big_fil_rev_8_21_14_0_10_44_54]